MARLLPPGAIRPAGWLARQLRLQADGCTGRLEEIWPDVGPDSAWRGGGGEDWERGPYYLDGLVPLAYVLDDARLQALAAPWLEWILASQDESGFFGPTSNLDWWPRMVALKVMTEYADASGDGRVVPFAQRYFRYQLRELPGRPLDSWGAARGADNALSVWWLYERTGEAWLLELIDLLHAQTLDWPAYLERELITGSARYFSHLTHGPNVAMGLKTAAVASLRSGDGAWEVATERALAELDHWHGQVHGWFSGDEWLGGPAATAGIETCQVVEMMFTVETWARISGAAVHGDRLESLAFNLLPAACDPAMRAHQYLQQANQVRISVDRRGWSFSGDDANLFGLEPNFGCCTANLHQGWPKFVRSLWMLDDETTLRAVAYAPCAVTAELGGVPVRVDVETEYPFDETIRLRVSPERPLEFELRLRIPGWCSTPQLAVNGEQVVMAVEDGHLAVHRRWADGDEVRLVLPMRPRVVRRAGQAVGVRLGPLQMVLGVEENWLLVPGAAGLGEWEIHPRRSWNYALDVRRRDQWSVERRPTGSPPFALREAPVTVLATGARALGWALAGAEAAPPPPSPVFEVGPPQRLHLVPYGCARLRVSEFPTAESELPRP